MLESSRSNQKDNHNTSFKSDQSKLAPLKSMNNRATDLRETIHEIATGFPSIRKIEKKMNYS